MPWFSWRRRHTRPFSHRNTVDESNVPGVNKTADLQQVEEAEAASWEELLTHHILNYTGQTVMVFTNSGGISGQGFTGVLLDIKGCCVRLLTRIGPPPACVFSGFAAHDQYNLLPSLYCNAGHIPVYSPGAITCIPLCKIAAFVHNVTGADS